MIEFVMFLTSCAALAVAVGLIARDKENQRCSDTGNSSVTVTSPLTVGEVGGTPNWSDTETLPPTKH